MVLIVVALIFKLSVFFFKFLVDLEKQKRRAENKGNLAEVARLCNSGGELLSSAGKFVTLNILLYIVLTLNNH